MIFSFFKLQVICLADNNGVSVILEAIRQVVQLHLPFGITYFHIGADEAFQVYFFFILDSLFKFLISERLTS